MTTTEQIQEIISEINGLNSRVTTANNAISTNTFNINKYHNQDVESINNINTQINTLQTEDVELHREIHGLENDLIETNSYLNTNIFNTNTLSYNVDNLSYTVSYNKNYQDNENVELHREIHDLGNSFYSRFDENSTSIFNINKYLNDVPQHVLCSESEYQSISHPDADKYYFVYEED